MGRGNAALQRKLEEVESEIGRLLEHPPSHIHDDDDGKVSFYQTARKIDFIKNLLTAEMDSRSRDRPEHLNRMVTRLSILEKAFVDWASPARFSVLDETFANGVESADNNGAVDKCPDTSASCSCTESCVVDEEFEEESNINQEAKEFDSSETETVPSHVSQARVEGNKEEVMEGEKENERNQEEERKGGSKVEATKDEKIRDRKQEETGEGTVEVNEDEEEGREKKEAEMVSQRKVEVNEDEKVGEKKQEAETTVQERRDNNWKEKTVGEVKVETTEEKGRRKQGGDTVGERKSEAKRNKGSERKEGPELVGESRANEREEEMAGEKTTEAKEEKETERNQERLMAGESKDEVIDDKKPGRERKKKGEMTRARRERNREAEMVGVQKAEVNQDEEGGKRKQQCRRVRSCMAMGCAAIAGFTIALIGVALANISCVEETVYLVPT